MKLFGKGRYSRYAKTLSGKKCDCTAFNPIPLHHTSWQYREPPPLSVRDVI